MAISQLYVSNAWEIMLNIYVKTVIESWSIAWLDWSKLAFARLDSFSAKIFKIVTRWKDCIDRVM